MGELFGIENGMLPNVPDRLSQSPGLRMFCSLATAQHHWKCVENVYSQYRSLFYRCLLLASSFPKKKKFCFNKMSRGEFPEVFRGTHMGFSNFCKSRRTLIVVLRFTGRVMSTLVYNLFIVSFKLVDVYFSVRPKYCKESFEPRLSKVVLVLS